MPMTTMSVRDAGALADRLARRGTERKLAEEIAILETEARTAGRLIRALLRHVSPTDVFQLPPEA